MGLMTDQLENEQRLRKVEERLQTICDLASARLATLLERERTHGKNVNTLDFDNIIHDLKEIVRITGKVWR